MRIAQFSAQKDGFGRPFFSGIQAVLAAAGVLFGLATGAQPSESIYRCGQEYTNAPQGKRGCVRLVPQAVTVIEGTHLNAASPSRRTLVIEGPALVPPVRTKVEADRPDAPIQRERDTQARTIVTQELEKARQQQAQLMQAYKQSETDKSQTDVRAQAQWQERQATLKAALDRNQRDIDSLQRELARRPMAANP